jgi:hypothetical protein
MPFRDQIAMNLTNLKEINFVFEIGIIYFIMFAFDSIIYSKLFLKTSTHNNVKYL